MKRAYFVPLFLCLAPSLLSQSNPVSLIDQTARVVSPLTASPAGPQAQARILDQYGKLPLSFEANQGQSDARVKFLSRTGAYSLFLTGDEAVLTLRRKKPAKSSPWGLKPASWASLNGTAEATPFPRTIPGTNFGRNAVASDRTSGAVVRMKLSNSNFAAKVTGVDEFPGTSNYFIGNNPAKWRTKVPTYAKVKYEGIYPGIDLIYYGNQRQLEYDFIVAPGADPRRIAFDIRGARRIRRDPRGDLVLKVGENELRWRKPVVYQEKDGARQLVAARYAVTDNGRVRFEVANYDASRTLYIDPLIYSTYLGGSGFDWGYGIAVDNAGNAYVTGKTCSADFPTMNPLQPAYGGDSGGGCPSGNTLYGDAFVTKINPTGSALVYSTYLGGSGGEDDWGPAGIAVDSAGAAYVAGGTASTDFPITPGAFQTTSPGYEEAFVTKISPTGSALVYSTYLGRGGAAAFGIAVDSAGYAYVTGLAFNNFPLLNPLQTYHIGSGGDAFVTELNPAGSALVYSTYLGGSGSDAGTGIVVDSAGSAYITGIADQSRDFPVTPGAFQTANAGNQDVFVTKINPTGSALVYSTYLGGSNYDYATGIAVDDAGNAYVTGATYSFHFPVTPGAFQTYFGGYVDAFVAKFNPTGSALVYSTYLGGGSYDWSNGIAVDSAGNAYITGFTSSRLFPTANSVQKYDGGDAFVSKLNPSGSALVYSTFLGGNGYDAGQGIAVDSAGNAFIAGVTGSTDFPITPGAFQTACGGGTCSAYDGFVAKLFLLPATKSMLTSSLNPSTYGQAVTFTSVVSSAIGAPPDGETVTFKKDTTVLGTGTLSGGSASFTTSMLPGGTNYIKAVYGGDANFAPSTSKALKQVVNKATTTTTLTSSLNPSNFGQAVTFTATVTPQFNGTVKAPVTFYDGTTVLKTVGPSLGVAKYKTSTLTSGSHSITATFNGGIDFLGSSASLTQQVK